MSTIVGIVDNGKVWLGADSFATTVDGDRRRMKVEKIIENGPYLIGYIGSVRNGQVLKPEYFTPPEKVCDFPDAIIEHYREKGCLGVHSELQTVIQEGNILVATKEGKLYEILMDFQMNEIPDYTSVGAGSPFALGSLYTTRKSKDHEKRIRLALKVASVYSTSTGPPFVIKNN